MASIKNTSPVLRTLLLHGFAVTFSILLVFFPVEKRIILPSGSFVVCWMFAFFRFLLPVLVLATFLLSLLLWRKAGVLLSVRPNSRYAQWASAFRPLSWLPFVLFLSNCGSWFGARVASLFVPYGTALILAFVLERILSLPPPAGNDGFLGKRPCWRRLLPFLLYAVILLFSSYYIGGRADGGDACHYKIQLQNLRENGNLDLTERFSGYSKKQLWKSHIRRNKQGRLYSYHSYGFPVLAWLFFSIFGYSVGPHLLDVLLGLLATAGCAAGARALGVPRRETTIATMLLALSSFWIAYSVSFLPEMLGCLCCAWAFWAIPVQNEPRKRFLATAVSAVCCVALPFAHIRFLPPALMLFGFFGLEGLLIPDEPFWKRKAPRLAGFALFSMAGFAALYLSHRTMFSGSSAYNYQSILFQSPIVMWGMFSDSSGLTPIFPSLLWFAPAALTSILFGGKTARWAAMAVLTSASILLTCCTTPEALRGECLGGRYLLQAVPILFPVGALAFARSDKTGRLWFCFLGLLPVLYFAFLLWSLSGTEFVRVPSPLWWRTPFDELFQPLCSFIYDKNKILLCASSICTIGLLLTSLVLAIPPARLRGRAPVATFLLLLGLASGLVADAQGANTWSRNSFWHFGRMRMMHAFRSPSAQAAGFVGNVGCRPKDLEGPDFIISDVEMQKRPSRMQVSPSSPSNDWFGRPLTWGATRFKPIRNPYFGGIFLSVEGKVVRGSGRIHPIRGQEALRKDQDILLPPNSSCN